MRKDLKDFIISDVYEEHGIPQVGNYRLANSEWAGWARRNGLHTKEYLLPTIHRECSSSLPSFMRENGDFPRHAVQKMVSELGPWTVPFRLMDNLWTFQREDNIRKMTFRSHLITGAVEEMLGTEMGTTTFLDMATRNGYFAFDVAARGAQHVDAFDLRERNVRQTQFLKEYYRISNVSLSVENVFDLGPAQYDVVLNLGLLYHVNDPLRLMQMTFDRCTRFAVIDTAVRLEPFQGFIFVVEQDTERSATGEFSCEFHPTYRAVIALMRQVGFKDLLEVVGQPDAAHDMYNTGRRRCIIGFK
jgi:hypothetical protein